jgi:hypothetical protein
VVHVQFIDTSVLCNLLAVPGRISLPVKEIQQEFVARFDAGTRFVLPITTIVETGNFIAQCTGDRRGAAQRFCDALRAAASRTPPWLIAETAWDSQFITELLAGNGTSTSMVDHFTHKTLGSGDLTILVERDRYAAGRALDSVEVWTLDSKLDAYAR